MLRPLSILQGSLCSVTAISAFGALWYTTHGVGAPAFLCAFTSSTLGGIAYMIHVRYMVPPSQNEL